MGSTSFFQAAKEDQLVESEIAARVENLEDELELLHARLGSKNAELKVAIAREELAQGVVIRNDRLNSRIKGAVSDEDFAKSEGERRQATAERAVQDAGIREIKVLIKQTTRKLGSYKALLKPADPKPAGN